MLVLGLGLSVAAGQENQDRPATQSQQYRALAKEFREAANAFYVKGGTEGCSPGESLLRCLVDQQHDLVFQAPVLSRHLGTSES
jgi:hypothetical protein